MRQTADPTRLLAGAGFVPTVCRFLCRNLRCRKRRFAPNCRPKSVFLSRHPLPSRPPAPDWLHEIKHDGHRLLAVTDGRGSLTLRSRNGFDRTHLFRAPFGKLAKAGHQLVIDGEICAPDDDGVTHIDGLNDAISVTATRIGWPTTPSISSSSTGTTCAAARCRSARNCCGGCSTMRPRSASFTSII